MTLVLQNRDFAKSYIIMQKLEKEQQNILGVPKLEALSFFVDHCIEQKFPSKAIVRYNALFANHLLSNMCNFQACIQYCADAGFQNFEELAVRLVNALTLDETHIGTLSKIVSPDILKRSTSNTNDADNKKLIE